MYGRIDLDLEREVSRGAGSFQLQHRGVPEVRIMILIDTNE